MSTPSSGQSAVYFSSKVQSENVRHFGLWMELLIIGGHSIREKNRWKIPAAWTNACYFHLMKFLLKRHQSIINHIVYFAAPVVNTYKLTIRDEPDVRVERKFDLNSKHYAVFAANSKAAEHR